MLHVDKNEYYGGSEAALTLQDAEEWVEKVNKGELEPAPTEEPNFQGIFPRHIS